MRQSCSNFNGHVTALVKKLELKAKATADRNMVYRLKNRIAAAQSADIATLIDGAAPVLVEFSGNILAPAASRDEFYLTVDVKAEYLKRHPDDDIDDESFSLINMIRTHYSNSSPAEREEVHRIVCLMLAESTAYMLEKSGQK